MSQDGSRFFKNDWLAEILWLEGIYEIKSIRKISSKNNFPLIHHLSADLLYTEMFQVFNQNISHLDKSAVNIFKVYTCMFISSNFNIIEIFQSHFHFLFNNCLSLHSPHLTCIFCTEMIIKMLLSTITFTSQRTIFSCTFSDGR